jgi:hypothetical protein
MAKRYGPELALLPQCIAHLNNKHEPKNNEHVVNLVEMVIIFSSAAIKLYSSKSARLM